MQSHARSKLVAEQNKSNTFISGKSARKKINYTSDPCQNISKKGRAGHCEPHIAIFEFDDAVVKRNLSVCWHLAFACTLCAITFMGYETLYEKVHLKHAHMKIYKM